MKSQKTKSMLFPCWDETGASPVPNSIDLHKSKQLITSEISNINNNFDHLDTIFMLAFNSGNPLFYVRLL